LQGAEFSRIARINHLSQGGFLMFKKLAKIGGPVLALCIVAAAPLIGSPSALADGDGSSAPAATSTAPPPATTDGNPWHG
jgi:hypothetical protein